MAASGWECKSWEQHIAERDAEIARLQRDNGRLVDRAMRAEAELAEAQRERDEQKAECDRAWVAHREMWQDRYDALNAQTTEGWSAAEWQLRTGKAERERDEALALLRDLRDHYWPSSARSDYLRDGERRSQLKARLDAALKEPHA